MGVRGQEAQRVRERAGGPEVCICEEARCPRCVQWDIGLGWVGGQEVAANEWRRRLEVLAGKKKKRGGTGDVRDD